MLGMLAFSGDRTDMTVENKIVPEIGRTLESLRTHLAQHGIKNAEDQLALKQPVEVLSQFLDDARVLSPDDLLRKYSGPSWIEYGVAATTIQRLNDALETLANPKGTFRSTLRDVLKGSLAQDFEISSAKDKFYEIELASIFTKAGFEVEFTEKPDLILRGNGLSEPCAVACKHLSSLKTIGGHLSKGYDQIADSGERGFIALAIENVVAALPVPGALADYDREPILAKQPAFMNFDAGRQPPYLALKDILDYNVPLLPLQRAAMQPAEKPMDCALISLSFFGHHRGRIVDVRAFDLIVEDCHPIANDMKTICLGISAVSNG